MLTDLAELEGTLGQQVQVLVGAISHVRDRQLAQVEVVREIGTSIRAFRRSIQKSMCAATTEIQCAA